MRVAALALGGLLAPAATAAAQAPLEDLGPAQGALLSDGRHVVFHTSTGTSQGVERCASTGRDVTARGDVVAFVEDTTAAREHDLVHGRDVRSGRRARWSVERLVSEEPVLAGGRVFLIANTSANTHQLLAGGVPR